jgi:hypothetical protein
MARMTIIDRRSSAGGDFLLPRRAIVDSSPRSRASAVVFIADE